MASVVNSEVKMSAPMMLGVALMVEGATVAPSHCTTLVSGEYQGTCGLRSVKYEQQQFGVYQWGRVLAKANLITMESWSID